MSYAVELTKQAADEFNHLSMGSSKFRILLEKALYELENLELQNAINLQEVKVLSGIEKQTKNNLELIGFSPLLFEYRNFPKSFPVRIVFTISKDETRILIWAIYHHKDMNQSKFMKSLSSRVKNRKTAE